METEIGFLFIITAILSLMTPLSSHGGYLLGGALVVILVLYRPRLVKKKVAIMLIIETISFMLYLLCTPHVTNDMGLLNTAFITYAMMIVGTVCIYADEPPQNRFKRIDIALDASCELIWALTILELVRYIYKYKDRWDFDSRLNGEADFWGIYHHVDYSVIVFLVCAIMLKRKRYIETAILAIASTVVLLARTWKLFVIAFVACFLLKNIIYKICSKGLLRHSITWMIISTAAVLALAYIWIYYLVDDFTIVEGHTGMYDDSNFVRFQTFIYGARVNIKERLIVGGLDTTLNYSTIINDPSLANIALGPHNTYLKMIQNYGLCFAGCYFFFMSKLTDKYFSKRNVAIVIPYFLAACILHDMFTGARGMLYIAMLIIPFREDGRYFAGKRIRRALKSQYKI